MQCRGHGETPSENQTQYFIRMVDNFITKKPTKYIGVHCTHGFNRTGFLIVAYMVLRLKYSVESAISAFAEARSPGIYKQDYINELFRRYGGENTVIMAPEQPTWCVDVNGREQHGSTARTTKFKRHHSAMGPAKGNLNSMPKRHRKEFVKLDATFMAGVEGVSLVTQQPLLRNLQAKIQEMCKFHRNGFPGSQPVSMDIENIALMQTKPYQVSWKADGTRYMMLILKENEIYFFDRNNSCFKVDGIRFPSRDDLKTHINETLIDGVSIYKLFRTFYFYK